MALKNWIRFLVLPVCALVLGLLLAIPAAAAVDTAPDLPPLQSAPSEGTTTSNADSSSVSSPSDSYAAPSSDNDKMIWIGILVWVAFLLAAGIVIVLVFHSKKNPPGGAPPTGKGRKGDASPETLAYKERMLSDQHYRKY